MTERKTMWKTHHIETDKWYEPMSFLLPDKKKRKTSLRYAVVRTFKNRDSKNFHNFLFDLTNHPEYRKNMKKKKIVFYRSSYPLGYVRCLVCASLCSETYFLFAVAVLSRHIVMPFIWVYQLMCMRVILFSFFFLRLKYRLHVVRIFTFFNFILFNKWHISNKIYYQIIIFKEYFMQNRIGAMKIWAEFSLEYRQPPATLATKRT